jgi:hypothetical protein
LHCRGGGSGLVERFGLLRLWFIRLQLGCGTAILLFGGWLTARSPKQQHRNQ